MNAKRLVNSFVSVTDVTTGTTIYVSEVRYRAMTHHFTEFDLSHLKTRNASRIKVQVWCQNTNRSDWDLLMNVDLALAALVFVAETLPAKFSRDNVVLVELTDGFYMLPNQYTPADIVTGGEMPHANRRHSSSFDQLMKMANLQRCIKDSERNKQKVADVIEIELDTAPKHQLMNTMQLLRLEVEAVTKECEAKKAAVAKMAVQIREQKLRLQKAALQISDLEQERDEAREAYGSMLNEVKTTEQDLKYERVKLVNVIKRIFPIEPLDFQSNEFTILGSHLPLFVKRGNITRMRALEIAFALNVISQIVNLLAYYLQIPLRFSIEIFGSNSYINDQISQLNSTMFPLWLNNLHNLEKFEFGLLLLNKNIEQLLESIGMKAIDHRNTLGNLNLLLICLSDDNEALSNEIDNALIKKRIRQVKKKQSQLLLRQRQQHQV